MFVLLITCLLILGALFGLFYLSYRLITYRKEQYLQFDDTIPAAKDL
jgi:hypothetical protein